MHFDSAPFLLWQKNMRGRKKRSKAMEVLQEAKLVHKTTEQSNVIS